MNFFIKLLFAATFLISSAFADAGHKGHNEHAGHAFQNKPMKMEFVKYENGRMFVKILDSNNMPMPSKNFKTSHTKKVHIFTISENLESYTHVHPKDEKESGVYSFEWNEDKTQNWRVWADLVPIKTGIQEYTSFVILNSKKAQPIVTKESLQQVKNDVKFEISFDNKIEVGKNLMMKLKVINKDGKPFTKLEKIMGAYAHVVAFSGNNESIIHIHPMKEDAKNGELMFHVNFPKKGFVKMFVQVQIDGKDYFIPFGFFVK